MSDLVLPVTPGTLPAGACPASYQDMLNLFTSFMSVIFPASQGNVVVSATTPVDTSATWLQLDSLGRPVRWYSFASGAWLSLHPCVPGFTMIWTTALPTMTTFDGGDAAALSAISGQMWEVVSDAAARTIMGVGTLPSGTPINVGDKIGNETIPFPNHTHVTGRFFGASGSTADDWCGLVGADSLGGSAQVTHGDNGLTTTDLAAGPTGPYTVTGPVQNNTLSNNIIPPTLGVYLLRRTARLFYRV